MEPNKMINNKKESITSRLKRGFLHFMEIDKYQHDEVVIKEELAKNIIELAKNSHPKEFVALIRGEVRKSKLAGKTKTLVLESLVYQTYSSANDVAVILPHFMTHTGTVGSVHSHPGPSNTPSNADKLFFSKNGMVHIIICRPYRKEDIAMYGFDGRRIEYKIVD